MNNEHSTRQNKLNLSSLASSTHRWRPRTVQVRSGLSRSNFCETAEGLFLTSGYTYSSAEEAQEAFNGVREHYVYSRFKNPTVRMFETRLAEIEEATDCRATASGMAAVFSSLACCLSAGDRIVASRALFGSCTCILTEILPQFNVRTTFVDGTDLEQWEEALSIPAKIVFLETPSNPTLDIIDLKTVCKIAHDKAHARVIVDNVFATPVLQKPLQLGADTVVYSATKHIDGQGRCLGGAVLSNDQQWIDEKLTLFLRHTGPILSPFNAWVLLKSLETLDLRINQHCDNALEVATFLESCPEVTQVIYPSLTSHPQHTLALEQMRKGGNVIAFTLKSRESAYQVLNKLSLIDISNNLGDTKSLITHPATTTHQRLSAEEREQQNITDNLVRLSVGLEDVQDLIEDLSQALKSVRE